MAKFKVPLIILVLLITAFFFIIRPRIGTKTATGPVVSNAPTTVSENQPPQIISTTPDPLEDTIVPASGTIEITFNRPLQNVGEFKSRIESNTDYKVTLSSDRKTAIIGFQKPLELGTTYTLFIEPDTKFDGVGAWGQEKVFHFRTVKYTGV